MRRNVNSYYWDEKASVTIFTVVIFAFLITFAGLVFDIGRIYNLHSQAQAYVDEVALTAAAELDGESGAITRAIRAAVGDGQHGALLDPGFRLTLSNDNIVNVQSMTFLESIAEDPAPGDVSPIAGDAVLCTYEAGVDDCTAEDSGSANFVLVNTTVETENFLLFPIAGALVPGMIDQASVQPQALAGFTREICNYPPMAICNPQENTTAPYGGGFTVNAGQQILLQTQGNNSSWAPGDFGFLDLTDVGANGCTGGGGDYLRCVLATLNPNTSCISTEVDMNPGQVTSADVGFNVRFDIYDPPFQNDKSNPNFAPAVNVTKGFVDPGNCRLDKLELPPATSPSVGFPKDPDVTVANRIGSGVLQADLDTYWATNHPPATTAPAGVDTRYKAYLREISDGIIVDNSGDLPDAGENGNPTCSTVPPVPKRRNIIVAVLNCLEHNVQGSANDVPVINFMEMFLTNPAGDPTDNSNHDIYAEVISIVEPGGDDGVLHEFPVLYR